MTMDPNQITLASLNISTESLDEEGVATDAILIVKLAYPDGRSQLWWGGSKPSSWIEQIGMLRLAQLDAESDAESDEP